MQVVVRLFGKIVEEERREEFRLCFIRCVVLNKPC